MSLRKLLRRGGDLVRISAWRRLVVGAAVIAVLAVGVGWAAAHLVELPQRLDAGDSVVATYEDGRPAHALLADDDRWRLPTRLDDVDPAYIEALLALEDRRFRWHPGVDPVAVVRAGVDNLRAGSTVSGASTITMQLVRLLEPRPRTLSSKVVEALRAMQLEARMSKDEILEAYLRFAPYGRNLEGIEAATLSYWDRTPAGLSSAEIATLLAVPQNPGARRPAPDNRETLRQARDEIAGTLADDGAIPMADRPGALDEMLEQTEVPTQIDGPPREIPHVVRWLERHRPEVFERREAGRGEAAIRIETTLERAVQDRIAGVVAEHRPRLEATGAPHATAVVLESETGAVRGVVGNLDFDPATAGSQIPAFASPRSTGSLLKPVAYAAALDEGVVAPSHRLADAPMVRGDYRPENFDRQFRGLVEAERALALSLNIPFVRLVERLGVDEFVQAMARFELEGPVRRSGDGGLEMVVGGMAASALEVASLYAGFARGGSPVEPRIYDVDEGGQTPVADDRIARGLHEMFVEAGLEASPAGGDGVDETDRAITEAAAWLTTRAMTRRSRPRAQVGPRRAVDQGFAWKTGTSYGYHDAWTAGFGGEYTAVVWAGDLGFERHPQLVGAGVAAPLFFDIVEAVDEPVRVRETRPREELAEIEVCAVSGRRPGEHCERTRTTEAPARTAAPETCEMHRQIEVDAESGRRLPEGCRPADVRDVERRVVRRLPAPVARYERARGRSGGTMPEVHPECRTGSDEDLAITSPAEGSTVVLESSRPADRQQVRLEAYSPTGSKLHWYIDGRHLETAGPDEAVYWTPRPGDWTIAAVETGGQRAVCELEVIGEAGVGVGEGSE